MKSTVRTSLLCFLVFTSSWLTSAQSRFFTLQVESLQSQTAAIALVNQLNTAGTEAYYLQATLPGKGTLYRVRVGQFATTSQARAQGEKLRHAGIIKEYFVTKFESPSPPASESAAVAPVVPPQASSSAESWEAFFAGGASFWTHNDTTISDFVSTGIPAFQLRQEFVTGVRVTAGVVKNINSRSGFELSYSYGTNNFRLTALGGTLDVGNRSHWIGYNYRHNLITHGDSKLYVTAGGGVAIFVPHEEASNLALVVADGNLNAFTLDTVARPMANFGGGGIVRLSDRVGLRFDVRDYLTFGKRVKASGQVGNTPFELKLFGGTAHNVVPNLGLVFKF